VFVMKKITQLFFFLITIVILVVASSFVSIWVFMLFSVDNFDEFIKLIGCIVFSLCLGTRCSLALYKDLW
jgi:hypothetical protein